MTHILHLEDDGPLREILHVALSAADPTIKLKQFISSDEAIAHIKAHLDTIDLFILDIRVPGSKNGIEVAEEIRRLGSSRPIIITSAFRKPEQHRLDSLNCTWMPKPWHILEAHKTILPLARA